MEGLNVSPWSSQNWILLPQPKESLVYGRKRDTNWEMPFPNATVWGRRKVIGYQQIDICSNLLRITVAHSDCCSNGNIHNHFSRSATFLLTIPPKANPLCFIPRGIVFQLIRLVLNPVVPSTRIDFEVIQRPPPRPLVFWITITNILEGWIR